jgi:hypothetical protein
MAHRLDCGAGHASAICHVHKVDAANSELQRWCPRHTSTREYITGNAIFFEIDALLKSHSYHFMPFFSLEMGLIRPLKSIDQINV